MGGETKINQTKINRTKINRDYSTNSSIRSRDDPVIRKLILQEAHDSPYSIHPGNTKMYLDLKDTFWWTGMKKDIAEYVVVCDVC